MRVEVLVVLSVGMVATAEYVTLATDKAATAGMPDTRPADDPRPAFDLLFKRDMERVARTASPAGTWR